MLVLPACGGGGSDADDATGGGSPAAKTTDETGQAPASGALPDAAAAISDATDLRDSAPDPGEPDGERASNDAATAGRDQPLPDDQPDAQLDPCSLVTRDEWDDWLDGTEPDGPPVHLEYGEACGFLSEGDEVRLAIALIDLGGESWLDGEDSETIDVEGREARWAQDYPIDASSTLAVTTDAGELVIEMSGGSREQQRDGAEHFASLALARVPS
jgi:hypothetical protein